jgi:hypothetical protein
MDLFLLSPYAFMWCSSKHGDFISKEREYQEMAKKYTARSFANITGTMGGCKGQEMQPDPGREKGWRSWTKDKAVPVHMMKLYGE